MDFFRNIITSKKFAQNKLVFGGMAIFILLVLVFKIFKTPSSPTPSSVIQKVYATPIKASVEKITVRTSGTTKASQKINLVSETSGEIYHFFHRKGHIVNPKDSIATIHLSDRAQQLKEVKAAYNLAKEKLDVTKKLMAGNFRSELNLKSAEVEFEAAAARLAKIEKEIENTRIIAPFKGVIGDVLLEEGSVVAPGTVVATLLNLNPILVQAYVSEKNYGHFKIGDNAKLSFANGEKVEGKVTFISSIADPKTHMFLLEIQVDNPDFKFPEGATARIDIPTMEKKVHKINPSVLSIDAAGNLAVKVLNKENKVESYSVEMVQSVDDIIWVTGLPDETILINYGAHFVSAGDTVAWEPSEKLKGPESAQ